MTGSDPRTAGAAAGSHASGSANSHPPAAGTRPPVADSPLVWNVAGLLGEGIGAVRDYVISGVDVADAPDAEDAAEADTFTLAAPVEGRIHLARTNRGLLVDADFTTVLATECVRCLREMTVPLAFEIHDEALPSLDLKTGKTVALSAEDAEAGVIRLTNHHELDLEQPIREAIVLALQIAPLDRVDCPGLCIVCGLPLDEGTHDHPDDDIDPRLEALRGFIAEG